MQRTREGEIERLKKSEKNANHKRELYIFKCVF